MVLIFLCSMMFFCGVISFFFKFKHLLINLLSLEMLVISLFLLLMLNLNLMKFELFFSLFYLSFSVCEGVLGLSLMISMIRNFGNNYFQSFFLFLC